MAMVGKPTIFVSYSHEDQTWLDYLKSHLGPALRAGSLDVWDDTRLRGGDDWQAEIEKAMRACKVCILLVSRRSLTSDYIDRVEMKTILERVAKEGVRIYPVFVSPVHVPNEHWLRKFNWRPRDGRPLMDSTKSADDFGEIIDEILDETISEYDDLEAGGAALNHDENIARSAHRNDGVGSEYFEEKSMVYRRAEFALSGEWIKSGDAQVVDPKIEDVEDLERWLAGWPDQVGFILAVRGAFRIAPLLFDMRSRVAKGRPPSTAILPLFRSLAMASELAHGRGGIFLSPLQLHARSPRMHLRRMEVMTTQTSRPPQRLVQSRA